MSIVIVFIKNLIVYGNCGTGEELVDALTVISGCSLATLKNLIPWFQKNLYNDILNFLIDDWSYINNDNNKSRKIMFKYAKISRIVLFIQLLGAYGTLIPVIMRYPSDIRITNEYNNDTILISCAIVFIKNFIVYGNCGSSEELVDALTLMSGSFLAILKNTLPWFQKNLYNDILDFLIDDWSDINNNNNKSRKIMFKYAKISRIVLFIQLLGAYGSLISLIAHYPSTNQIMNEYNNDSIFVRNIPYGPRCWISLTMPWNLYVGFYIILCVDLFFLTTSFIGSDVFLFTIAIHVCGQFEILYNSMENINYYKNYQQQHLFMKNFVIRHNQLLVMLENFEEICNKIIFFEVMGNTFLICISGK
ncbi:hypothetical protein HCN44_005547 [Aphidius gifuensis]|uniref:Odorant receptor n=1 Tax=Aphidius gifuensis TaxID=684658 RepID=A0A834Y3B4_APHGI|nr:hypothetical protein HCN44_005547 [Aphidius gifuensis]